MHSWQPLFALSSSCSSASREVFNGAGRHVGGKRRLYLNAIPVHGSPKLWKSSLHLASTPSRPARSLNPTCSPEHMLHHRGWDTSCGSPPECSEPKMLSSLIPESKAVLKVEPLLEVCHHC